MGRPAKIKPEINQPEQPTVQEQSQPVEQPQKVKPVITEVHRAMPKILAQQSYSPDKQWYLHNVKKGTKTAMSEGAALRWAGKYPTEYKAIYE